MKKIKITLLTVSIVVTVLIAYLVNRPNQYHTSERIEWKDAAIEELNAIESAKGIPPFKYTVDGWFSPQGLLMEDGSWIAYRQRCHKEDPRIEDIFIGRASNGKWYYSTYHFCIGACVVLMDEQPESLAAFIERCALVEFDGESDDCLLPTWPPKE
jgi:hypothetical protein